MTKNSISDRAFLDSRQKSQAIELWEEPCHKVVCHNGVRFTTAWQYGSDADSDPTKKGYNKSTY